MARTEKGEEVTSSLWRKSDWMPPRIIGILRVSNAVSRSCLTRYSLTFPRNIDFCRAFLCRIPVFFHVVEPYAGIAESRQCAVFPNVAEPHGDVPHHIVLPLFKNAFLFIYLLQGRRVSFPTSISPDRIYNQILVLLLRWRDTASFSLHPQIRLKTRLGWGGHDVFRHSQVSWKIISVCRKFTKFPSHVSSLRAAILGTWSIILAISFSGKNICR